VLPTAFADTETPFPALIFATFMIAELAAAHSTFVIVIPDGHVGVKYWQFEELSDELYNVTLDGATIVAVFSPVSVLFSVLEVRMRRSVFGATKSLTDVLPFVSPVVVSLVSACLLASSACLLASSACLLASSDDKLLLESLLELLLEPLESLDEELELLSGVSVPDVVFLPYVNV
jgi:Na+/H+ antiporter NhaC